MRFAELIVRLAAANIEQAALGSCQAANWSIAYLASIPGVLGLLSAKALAWLASCGFI